MFPIMFPIKFLYRMLMFLVTPPPGTSATLTKGAYRHASKTRRETQFHNTIMANNMRSNRYSGIKNTYKAPTGNKL
jgi:hypothetical protein